MSIPWAFLRRNTMSIFQYVFCKVDRYRPRICRTDWEAWNLRALDVRSGENLSSFRRKIWVPCWAPAYKVGMISTLTVVTQAETDAGGYCKADAGFRHLELWNREQCEVRYLNLRCEDYPRKCGSAVGSRRWGRGGEVVAAWQRVTIFFRDINQRKELRTCYCFPSIGSLIPLILLVLDCLVLLGGVPFLHVLISPVCYRFCVCSSFE